MAVDRNQLQEEAVIVRFYRIILSWDYLQLFKGAKKNNIHTDKSGTAAGLREVKDIYKNVEDYLATFEPLLFEEVKAQILQGTDEEVTEWKLGLVRECRDANGFHFPTVGYAAEQGESISQNDLLLISNEKFQEGSKLPKTYAFALVEHRQTDILRLRMFLTGEFKKLDSDSVVSCPRLLNMQSLITEMDKSLWILKICSLSTIAREYVALHSISYLPFKDLILTAGQSSCSSESGAWRISKSLMDSIVNNYNASQLEAINAGLLRKTFVLIQGPPGTGKTQTILGILSAILHATPTRVHLKSTLIGTKHGRELPLHDKYNHWMKASPWLLGVNNRDVVMPVDGDDGFFPTTGNELKPEVVTSSRKYRVRVLVCAPSNSALDEIVLRLLNTGIRDENDHTYHPKIVRIGLKPHHSVQAVSMDYLVGQKFASMEGSTADKRRNGTTTRDRDSIRASILDEAVIVFSTLSFSGSGLFSKLNRGFDVVIIDEAAQAVEPATLVPLSSGCKQVFLVGDPVQLPATVISPVADKFGYGESLFKRFQRAGYPVQMLKTQYRMHPEIRTFPSKEFYAEELEDGPDVLEQTKRDWHQYRCFGPFGFFDIHEGRESQPTGSGSWVNKDEVEFALLLHHKLISTYPELKSSSQFAIISPYRHQVKLFRDRFRDTYGVEADKIVDVNTVDGFQGREKDVAIFSCVRASESRGIGFVADFRRMNVGITRARSTVLVVGSASTLRQDEHWKNLIESAEKRNCLFRVSKPYDAFFNCENLKMMKVDETSAATDMEATYENAEMNVPLAGGDAVEGEQGQMGEDDVGDGDGDGDMDDGGGGYDDD